MENKYAIMVGTELAAIRSEDNINSEIIGYVNYGEQVPIIGLSEKGNFYCINYQGGIGYIYSEYLKEDSRLNG